MNMSITHVIVILNPENTKNRNHNPQNMSDTT